MSKESDTMEDDAKWEFLTEFDIGSEEPMLKIKNKGRVNRPLITQDQIGHTSFSAILHCVYYGSYHGENACLVAVDFSFRFRSKTTSRYQYAAIQLEFEKAMDVTNPKIRCKDPLLDPKVANFAPKEVYGMVSAIDQKKHWEVSIPVMFESPIGLSAGITGTAGGESNSHEDNRMEIHGNLYQDDEHDEGANGVTWDLQENKIQGDGIFRNFRGAIVVLHEPGMPFWMHLSVRPAIKFSLDPRRVVTKEDPLARLLQRNDHPILLDGRTPFKRQPDLGCDDFSAADFPWNKILVLPREYEVSKAATVEVRH